MTSRPSWFLDGWGKDWRYFGVRLLHLEGAPEIPSGKVISLAGLSVQYPIRFEKSYLIDAYALAYGPGGSFSESEEEGGSLASDDINFIDVGLRYVRSFVSCAAGYRWASVQCSWSDAASPGERADYDLTFSQGAFLAVSVGGHKLKNEVPRWWNDWIDISGSSNPENYADFIGRYPDAKRAKEAKRRLKALEPAAYQRAVAEDSSERYAWYRSLFPKGKYIEEVGNRVNALDDRAYARADSIATREAYEAYLAAYPAGRSGRNARTHRNELRNAELIAALDGYVIGETTEAMFDSNGWPQIPGLGEITIVQDDVDETLQQRTVVLGKALGGAKDVEGTIFSQKSDSRVTADKVRAITAETRLLLESGAGYWKENLEFTREGTADHLVKSHRELEGPRVVVATLRFDHGKLIDMKRGDAR